MMPKIRGKHPQITDEEVARRMLDVVLKKAVIYLHPFALPDKPGGCVRWCFGGVENDFNDRWLSYLDENYPVERADPAHPDRSLSSCQHILDCVYRVVCGHLLPPKADPADPDRSLSSWEHILDSDYRVVCGIMRDEGNYVGFWMLFVCCVYVLQVSMAMVALLQDGVAFVGLSRLNVWCGLLMLINCGTSLLMENKNGRILIN
jgi:hypothetical protein